MTEPTQADLVGAFAQDVAGAYAGVAADLLGLWGIQVGVVFPTAGEVTSERVWLFPVATDEGTSPPPDDAANPLLVDLDVQICALVRELYAGLVALGGSIPSGLRLQVGADDGATEVDLSYGELEVDALDPDAVSAWLDELDGM